MPKCQATSRTSSDASARAKGRVFLSSPNLGYLTRGSPGTAVMEKNIALWDDWGLFMANRQATHQERDRLPRPNAPIHMGPMVAWGKPRHSTGYCRICRRGLGTQAHILCECPALSQVRLKNHIDFNRASRRIPPGPERALGQAVVHLLHFHQSLEERTNSGRGYGPSRDAPSEPAVGSWWTSVLGPPPVSHIFGFSTKTHWRGRKTHGRQPPTMPPVSLPWHPPHAHPRHRGSGDPLSPPQHDGDDSESARLAPNSVPAATRPPNPSPPPSRRGPWAPPRHRLGPGPPVPPHLAPPSTLGTPAWGRTTAKPIHPPSCHGGHIVKSGASTPAMMGYCDCLRPVFFLLFFWMKWMLNAVTLKVGFSYIYIFHG